jgi:hypothetical protein
MKPLRRTLVALVLTGIFILGAGTQGRTEILEKSDHWKNFAALYGWAQAINGDMKIKGVETNVDVDFSDTFNALKFFFMGHYEGFKGDWGLMVDASYTQLEKDIEHPGGAVSGRRQIKVNQGLVELAVPYRFAWKPVVADAFVGGRYNGLYGEIAIPGRALEVDDNVQWVDLFVGARVFIPLDKKWYIGLRGDIGGFGLGNASDLALNGLASVNYQVNDLFSMHAGYRAYYLKYNEGQNEWNATQHGPWFGIGFSF